MDYEEKYKSALKWMQSLYGGLHGATKEEAEKYFPELKESEDERIRKELICFVENWKNFRPNSPFDDYAVYTSDSGECDKILAWLEKQQSFDKDKLAKGFLRSVATSIMNWLDANTSEGKMCLSNMECEDIENAVLNADWSKVYAYMRKKLEKQGEQKTDDVENYYHKFDIQDARDGDLIYVSTEEKGIQAIFHEYKNDTIFFHCYLCTDFVQGGCMPIGSVELTYPLQKTHYNRFFEKMHEAGYEWDNEKKELRKIESKTLDAAKVIEWLNDQACQGWIEDVEVDKFVDKFKKDFGL